MVGGIETTSQSTDNIEEGEKPLHDLNGLDPAAIAKSLDEGGDRGVGGIVKLLILLIAIGGVAALIWYGIAKITQRSAAVPGDELTVGALLSITGERASQGNVEKTILENAVVDANNYLTNIGSSKRLKLIVADTKSISQEVKAGIKNLKKQNALPIIGSFTDDELGRAIKLVDSEGLVISQQSGSIEYAKPNDGIYRFLPAGLAGGSQIAQKAWAQGAKKAIILYETSLSGLDAATAFGNGFKSAGGVVVETYGYKPTDQGIKETLRKMTEKIKNSTEGQDLNTFAIYFAPSSEVVLVMQAAQREDILQAIKWYGNSQVKQASLDSDDKVKRMLAKVEMTVSTPKINFDLRNKQDAVAAKVREVTGSEPALSTLSYYDSIWLLALAHLSDSNEETLRNKYEKAARSYFGVTGTVELDENGDRKPVEQSYWKASFEGNRMVWQSSDN